MIISNNLARRETIHMHRLSSDYFPRYKLRGRHDYNAWKQSLLRNMTRLLTVDAELMTGTIIDRPNRFVVRVRFGDTRERVFLGDPGALEGIVEPGYKILCSPVNDSDRSTDYDAIAVFVGDVCVSVRTTLANDLFESGIRGDAISVFDGYKLEEREPSLPDHGRTDFRLITPNNTTAYVEVKSCTCIDNMIAKFPDRQTERGRRHLRSLQKLHNDGYESHIVFVVQRPDVKRFQPYRDVDPEFADLLANVQESGVEVHAIVTAFEPPHYRLQNNDLSIELN
jgi:sugar fermentation stimulation protein A